MAHSQKVQAADGERSFRAETSGSARSRKIGRARCPEARDLGADAQCESIAVGFLEMIKDVLALRFSIGVLDRGIDAREDARVVHTFLNVGLLDRGERITRLQSDAPVHQAWPSGAQPRGDYFAHVLPIPFGDRISNVDVMRSSRLLPSSVEGGAREPAGKVISQHLLTVGSQACFREWLSEARGQLGKVIRFHLTRAVDLQMINEPLISFFNPDCDGKLAGLAGKIMIVDY